MLTAECSSADPTARSRFDQQGLLTVAGMPSDDLGRASAQDLC
jgi:hypothetical protein